MSKTIKNLGSVKDLKILSQSDSDKVGEGLFSFTDRYSVLDWGDMPDPILGKGAATAVLGAYFFEKLEKLDVSTHYKGLFENSIPKIIVNWKVIKIYTYRLRYKEQHFSKPY